MSARPLQQTLLLVSQATCRLRDRKNGITVPTNSTSWSRHPAGPPVAAEWVVDGARRKTYVLEPPAPLYLAVVISRFNRDTRRISAGGTDVAVYVQSSPRQASRVRDMGEKVAAVFKFYASLVGDAPYPSFTLAIAESDRPGGHSPPYFAMLNQVVIGTAFVWRNDPVSFENYPTFFLANEVRISGGDTRWVEELPRAVDQRRLRAVLCGAYAEKGPRRQTCSRTCAADAPHRHQPPGTRDRSTSATAWGTSVGRSRVPGDRLQQGPWCAHAPAAGRDDAFSPGCGVLRAVQVQKAGTDDFRRAREQTSAANLERSSRRGSTARRYPPKFSYHVAGEERRCASRSAARRDVRSRDDFADLGRNEDIVIALSERSPKRKLR